MKHCMPCYISRRSFLELAAVIGTSSLLVPTLSGCSHNDPSSTDPDIDYSDWDSVLKAAQGQDVSWYGWGGLAPRNKWIETVFAPQLQNKYGIKLNLVGMDINDILTQLSGEMQAGATQGSIDFIWINGENFFSTKENGFLWGPFCEYLPNFNAYVDSLSPEVAYDFGSPTEGFEAPYAKAQLHLWVDSHIVSTTPKNPQEFLELCKQFPGRITYPEPGDFIGTAFICSLIAGIIGKDSFEKLSTLDKDHANTDTILPIIKPGLDFLRTLNPYLWKLGKTFPADNATVSSMFADGELILNMGYDCPQPQVDDGSLPQTIKSFVFNTGTVGNSNFMAIAANAPHKPAALVAINEMLSPEMQLSQYEHLNMLTVLNLDSLSKEMAEKFADVPVRSAQIASSELFAHRISEASGPSIPIIEKLWLDHVATQ